MKSLPSPKDTSPVLNCEESKWFKKPQKKIPSRAVWGKRNLDDMGLWLMIDQCSGGPYLDEYGPVTIACAELADGRMLKVIGPVNAGLELYKTLFIERREGRL
jgi:hypothetical protein